MLFEVLIYHLIIDNNISASRKKIIPITIKETSLLSNMYNELLMYIYNNKDILRKYGVIAIVIIFIIIIIYAIISIVYIVIHSCIMLIGVYSSAVKIGKILFSTKDKYCDLRVYIIFHMNKLKDKILQLNK